MNPEHLLPLLVPASYFARGTWTAPHRLLAAPELAMTWVDVGMPDVMEYVSRSAADGWTAQGIDWSRYALDNLRRSAALNGAWTHEKRDHTGRLIWVAMMQPDGLGSSRVLLDAELRTAFPAGYHVALPERSCGLAIDATLTGADLAAVQRIIQQCWRGGATPMTPELFEPRALEPHAA